MLLPFVGSLPQVNEPGIWVLVNPFELELLPGICQMFPEPPQHT